ncbi:endospore germination permease [Paenibacillus sp. R14(2021)]|uniref:GerAB/ArcD/ProY family transporter n=1 Tax=Paenibacillus sp. R14(2021) TaxID=2859228 RepID=UPI001C611A33|nr:endospore germination permease [Paenibacillus sp. R14(2021)]
MIEKGRISPIQLAIFLQPFILATVSLSVPTITMITAGRDMWMTPILSSVTGFWIVYVCYRLHVRFPKQTFIQYTDAILGTYLGKTVTLMYLINFLYSNGIIVREYGEFIVGTFLLETPMIFIIVCLIAVCAYATFQGLEVWVRVAQLLIPMAIFLIFLMLVIMAPDMHVKEMLPILEYGPLPALRGSIVPSSWYSQFFVIALFLPYVKAEPAKVLKWCMISVASVVLTMLSINLSILFLFGEMNKGLSYAFLTAVRYISLSEFIEHIESILMAIWLVAIFIKVTVVYYLAVLGTAQWLKVPDYRVLVFPVGLLMVLFSIWAAPNFEVLKHLLGTSLPLFSLFFQVLIPMLLLWIAVLKGGGKHEHKPNA